jgi:hypothetical protein
MYHCVIIFAPEDKALRDVLKNIQSLFSKNLFTFSAVPAADALISDIAVAEFVIFASKKDSKKSIHPDFSELIRTFSGVNLSGRLSAFIGEKNSTTLNEFQNALKDTGISYFNDPLYIEDGIEAKSKSLITWIKKAESTFKEFINVHKF